MGHVRTDVAWVLAHQRTDLLPCDGASNITVLKKVKDEDGHIVVHAEAKGSRIGDLQAPVDALTG